MPSTSSPHTSSSSPPAQPHRSKHPNRKNFDQDANIHNFAPVARIMKMALPENAKIAKEAKECMQECVSEFISFITSEGTSDVMEYGIRGHHQLTVYVASEKCQQEKRKTVNGEDILFAMTSLGFENYGEALKIYLARYREVRFEPIMNPRATSPDHIC
jgi:histone H3/H4